jgi:hypothetical protein
VAATSPRKRRPRAAGSSRWADEVSEFGYVDMLTDMFDASRQRVEPTETLNDGYVVNAIMDACYRSAANRQWEPVALEWRGGVTPKISKPTRTESRTKVRPYPAELTRRSASATTQSRTFAPSRSKLERSRQRLHRGEGVPEEGEYERRQSGGDEGRLAPPMMWNNTEAGSS